MGWQNIFKWRRFFVDPPLKRDEKASGPPHYILQNQERPTPCDCGKKHSCHRRVMQYDCWSLETIGDEDGIKESDVLDNAT